MINSVKNISLDPELNKKVMDIVMKRAIAGGKLKGGISQLIEESLSFFMQNLNVCSQCGYPFYSPPDTLIDRCPNCGHLNHIKHS